MNITTVVNIYREPYDVYIGRPGKGQDGYFGNYAPEGDRDSKIDWFKEQFEERIKVDPEYRYRIHQLKGKRLGCFCKPQRCHGNIIAEYLNRLPEVKPVRLGVVGSRSFDNYEYLKSILQWFDISCVVSGGANGADSLGARYAIERGIPTKIYPADWKRFGKQAGYLRNKQIVEDSEELVAFWDGISKGTGHTVRIAQEAGKPIYIFWSPPTPRKPQEFAPLPLRVILTDDELMEFGL